MFTGWKNISLRRFLFFSVEKKSGYADSRYAVTRYAVTPITNNPQNVTIDAKCNINPKCNNFLTQNVTAFWLEM